MLFIRKTHGSFFLLFVVIHTDTPSVKFLFIIPFYRQFRLCFTNASGKAHTPEDARAQPQALPLGELPR